MRPELTNEVIRPAKMLAELMPDEPDVAWAASAAGNTSLARHLSEYRRDQCLAG